MRFACVDIETTGTIACIHDVIEVGISVIDENMRFLREEEFSLPFDVTTATPEALKVNGWGQRKFAPQITHDAAKDLLYEVFGEYKTTAFIGMHAHFDSSFLEAMLVRHCDHAETPWRKHVYDLPSLAAGRWGMLPPLRSPDMVRLLELETGRDQYTAGSDRHTALGDSRLVMTILRRLKLGPSWSQG